MCFSWRCKDQRYLIRLKGSQAAPVDSLAGSCQWSTNYSVSPGDLECVLSFCRHPHLEPGSHPPPPADHGLTLLPSTNWTIPFGSSVTYSCGRSQYFESNQSWPAQNSVEVECLAGLGEYNTPVRRGLAWPNCTSTVLCGPPPLPPLNGTISWNSLETYGTVAAYHCQDGSQFDTNSDGVGDSVSVWSRCQWNKVWDLPVLPDCFITHCVHPFPIPANSSLEEISPAWTPVKTSKEYQCQGKEGERHTMFWETDRSRSTHQIFCREDGYFQWTDWPTCIADVTCSPDPPVIPSHREYTRQEYDGTVTVDSVEYPSLVRTENLVLTSLTNNTLLAKNYMANLT